jgi:hypothetical protein
VMKSLMKWVEQSQRSLLKNLIHPLNRWNTSTMGMKKTWRSSNRGSKNVDALVTHDGLWLLVMW